MTKQEFMRTFCYPMTNADIELDKVISEAIAEHEAKHIKLSQEIFNQVQLKRVARMLKELSEESWKAAGGCSKEWSDWYKKRNTQHLNTPQEGGHND